MTSQHHDLLQIFTDGSKVDEKVTSRCATPLNRALGIVGAAIEGCRTPADRAAKEAAAAASVAPNNPF